MGRGFKDLLLSIGIEFTLMSRKSNDWVEKMGVIQYVVFCFCHFVNGVRWSATPKTETFNATTKTRIYIDVWMIYVCVV